MQTLVEMHIRRFRRRQGLSLVTFGSVVGISKSRLSRVELNEQECGVWDLARIAAEYHVPPWELVTFPGWECPCLPTQERP